MKEYGYKQSNFDHTLFIKKSWKKQVVLLVHADDMILTGDDQQWIQALKEHLTTVFEMKDLGQLKYFLGIEVTRSNKGIYLSQQKYTLGLLAKTGILDCKPVQTPLEMNHRLGIYPDQIPAKHDRYQKLVRKLIYLLHTRPDIAYAVSVVSQFMHTLSEDHMNAVLRIPMCLKGSPGNGLLFRKYEKLDVEGYTISDWPKDMNVE
ncbi:uncharacterized mitochondrial protein AtMg00810-like [Prosopis cineraria]|uniref:uncharacterized mitochondrial protein AtMg00810-like n=1 Tax=Prosopis cineraria TaxID=364024 RepID=UPI00240FF332|nr:uncharacterized mitochondrial protein AtMg00810-like [Prosopis cineraria]XP_054807815.1 uncharacterized mitochondrial protein AtMg00810-like [Prosopis cineraria]